MNYKLSIFFILLISVILAQQQSETIGFDAKTGKMYKIISSQCFDPMTGNMKIKQDTVFVSTNEIQVPVQPEPEVLLERKPVKLAFDPKTGMEVRSSDLTVISLARANARRNFQKTPWLMFGGAGTCGTMIAGATIGGTTFGAPGFLIGTIGMGIITPKVLSSVVATPSIIYPEGIDYRERALYDEHYQKEMKGQREATIYNGVLTTCGISAVLGFLMIMVASS